MINNIKIKNNWYTSGREEELEKLIKEKINTVNSLKEELYALREKEYSCLEIIDKYTKDLRNIEGVLFDFIPENNKPQKEIKNPINILIKGLDNTKL